LFLPANYELVNVRFSRPCGKSYITDPLRFCQVFFGPRSCIL